MLRIYQVHRIDSVSALFLVAEAKSKTASKISPTAARQQITEPRPGCGDLGEMRGIHHGQMPSVRELFGAVSSGSWRESRRTFGEAQERAISCPDLEYAMSYRYIGKTRTRRELTS